MVQPRRPSAAESSFRSHADLERPGEFLRREWRALLICCGGFVALLLTILFSVDASFFYPRIETDQMLYLLKAKWFVETGSTAATTTVNGRVFPYASMPGLLRAPFLFLFSDFDLQLRGIQLMNVVIAAATGVMSACILSWALPRSAHKWAIAFPFGFMLLSPDWMANIFVPLADAPYAALTLGFIILAAMTLTSKSPLASKRGAIALLVLLFTVAFFVRPTAPVLLLFAGMLAWQRWRIDRIPPAVVAAVIIIPILLIATLTFVASDAILGRYLWEPLTFARNTGKVGITLYLLASAIPSQIVPVFNLGFQVPPLTVYYSPVLASTPRDIVWAAAGLGLSAIAVHGAFIVRRKFLPELLSFLLVLPVLTVMTLSTIRYLMSYQPVIWLCFFTGLASITRPLRSRASPAQIRLLAGSLAIAAVAGVVAMRSMTTARTAGASASGSVVSRALAYARDVETTFASLREFLEGLPSERTLLIGGYGDVGRFTVIADRAYYKPDSNLVRVAAEKDVYAVLACGTRAACGQFDEWIARQARSVGRFGDFTYTPVFDKRTASARALVQRVTPARTEAYSASGRTSR